MRMMKKEKNNFLENCLKLLSKRKRKKLIIKKWISKDNNDEEGKNTVFWKIFEIAIEKEKKKLIIKKWTSRDIDNNEKRKN